MNNPSYKKWRQSISCPGAYLLFYPLKFTVNNITFYPSLEIITSTFSPSAVLLFSVSTLHAKLQIFHVPCKHIITFRYRYEMLQTQLRLQLIHCYGNRISVSKWRQDFRFSWQQVRRLTAFWDMPCSLVEVNQHFRSA